jgi:hypothetical protein
MAVGAGGEHRQSRANHPSEHGTNMPSNQKQIKKALHFSRKPPLAKKKTCKQGHLMLSAFLQGRNGEHRARGQLQVGFVSRTKNRKYVSSQIV